MTEGGDYIGQEKSRIRETLNLSTDADSSTDTKTDRYEQTFFIFFLAGSTNLYKGGKQKLGGSDVTIYMSHITCHMSRVT